MGFIEETGAAQHLRDARIALIYEGTNGIQANDLVGRKLARDGGAAVRELVAEMRSDAARELAAAAKRRRGAAAPLRRRHRCAGGGERGLWAISHARDPAQALAGAVPYLRLIGHRRRRLADGARARSRRSAAWRGGEGDARFCRAKLATARFFAEHVLATAPALLPAILGGATVMGFDLELL